MSTKSAFLTGVFIVLGLLSLWYSFRRPGTPTLDDTIIVGTNSDYPPYSYKEHDEIIGLDIDIAKEVIRRLDKKMEIEDMAFDVLITEIQMGKIHMIAAGMTETPERARQVFFTKPHLKNDPLIIISRADDKKFNSTDDLKGETVVVNQGYTADEYISSLPEITVYRSITPAEAFLALTSKRARAFIAARSSVQPFFKKHGTQDFHTTVIDGPVESYALAVSKKYPDLFKKVQDILDEMEQDGILATIKKKWGLSD